MGKALTVPGILKLRGGKSRREIWDQHGLTLIVQPSGAKSFAYRFRNKSGKPTKLPLGPFTTTELTGAPVVGQALTLPAARQLVGELNRRRNAGEDLIATYQAQRRRAVTLATEAAAASFVAASRHYIETGRSRSTRKGKDRSKGWRATAMTLGLRYPGDSLKYDGADPEIIPEGLCDRWRDRPVASITGDDLAVLIDECTETAMPGRKPKQNGHSDARGREMAAAISQLFDHLLRKRWIKVNPALGLDEPPAAIVRKRVLNSDPKTRNGDEVRYFWEATGQLNSPFKEALRLMLLLGQRRDEVAEAPWSEFSDDLNVWTLPPERTKNGEQHAVPIQGIAREILEDLKAKRDGSRFVFTTTRTTPVSGWSKTKIALDKKIAELAGGPIDAWRIHDLRRTAATGMAQIGVPPHIVEAVLNHLSGHKGSIAGVYNLATYPAEKADALKRWSEHILRLVK